jgi:hypothetical protein
MWFLIIHFRLTFVFRTIITRRINEKLWELTQKLTETKNTKNKKGDEKYTNNTASFCNAWTISSSSNKSSQVQSSQCIWSHWPGITLNKHSSLLHLPPLTNFFSQKPSYFGMWMTQRRHFPSLMSSKALLISSNGRLCVMNSSIWISCIKTVKLVQTSGRLYLKDTFDYRWPSVYGLGDNRSRWL